MLNYIRCFGDSWEIIKQDIAHSACGNLLIAFSLIVDGLLSTLLKCSAHLSKTTTLSVRSLLPSALRRGLVLELFGP